MTAFDFEKIETEFNGLMAEYRHICKLMQSNAIRIDAYILGNVRHKYMYKYAKLSTSCINFDLSAHIKICKSDNLYGFNVDPIISENTIRYNKYVTGFCNAVTGILYDIVDNHAKDISTLYDIANRELEIIKKEYSIIANISPIDQHSYMTHMRMLHENLMMNMVEFNPIELLSVDISSNMYIRVKPVCPDPPYEFYNFTCNSSCWNMYDMCVKSIEREVICRVKALTH